MTTLASSSLPCISTSGRKESHKEWRKKVKKLRRKRIRQIFARERDKEILKEEERKKNDPLYQIWLKEQKDLEQLQKDAENQKHLESEEKWRKNELLVQNQIENEKNKIENEESKQLLEIKQNIKEINSVTFVNNSINKYNEFMERISLYLKSDGDIPEELLQQSETNPGKKLCSFFLKTGSCRFGDRCIQNHIRPGISKIILLHNLFNHICLEQSKITEYGNDLLLEFDDADLYKDYDLFFDDVVPELEKFGKIKNCRTSQNYEPHLRGNVYVEYENERDALNAFINLQGRFYAGKRITVEFTAIVWKSALCGLSFTKRCPKGKSCNFIHALENPKNKYSVRLTNENPIKQSSIRPSTDSSRKRWRWSETPE